MYVGSRCQILSAKDKQLSAAGCFDLGTAWQGFV